MSTVFRERQRAARFAARVDGDLAADPGTLDPRLDAELDRLLHVVDGLRTAADSDVSAAPRPAFAADLRERLMAEAQTVLTPQISSLTLPARRHGRRERRLVAAATAAVLLGGTAGMAAASQGALPGQALYPVKRLLEKADVGLSASSTGRGQDLLSQASSRLDEVQGLMAAGPAAASAQVPATLQEFTRQADQGATQLLAAYAETHDPGTIATVRDTVAKDTDLLTVVARDAPATAQPALLDAAATLRDIDVQALSACPACSDLPPLRIPEALLPSATGEALGTLPPTSGPTGGTTGSTTGTPTPMTESGGDAASAPPSEGASATVPAGPRTPSSGGRVAGQSPAAVPTLSPGTDPVGGLVGSLNGGVGGSGGGSGTESSAPGASGTGSGTESGGGSDPGGTTTSGPDGSGPSGSPSPSSDPLGDVVGSLLPDVGSGGLPGN